MKKPSIVVLVHGWSVRNTNTYGELANRLKSEAKKSNGIPVDVRNIWLSKYISFKDEVRLEDLSRAFEAALHRELKNELKAGRRFACITHSTGGPVVRDWWDRFYLESEKSCPMSHLIMLAPANFGSALAQLGKGRLSRIKTWFQGVEPGQGVLDWLELGSPESWKLNKRWITNKINPTINKSLVFPFVLTGQTIDRYDHLNSYTGELGSDGVVRVAAANLNATYIKLVQNGKNGELSIDKKVTAVSWQIAFGLIRGMSHSGDDKGILKTIKDNSKVHPTVTAIINCLRVGSSSQYEKLRDKFTLSNETVFKNELVERQRGFLTTREFIHDQSSMVTIRLRDDKGFPIPDFDFILMGKGNDPNRLPEGFFLDRQRNSRDESTLTYFLNHSLMIGSPPIPDPRDKKNTLREETPGVENLGIKINPRPETGFVYHKKATLRAQKRIFKKFLKPNQTTMIDIVLQRVVRTGTFQLKKADSVDPKGENFSKQRLGTKIPDAKRS
jgi:hypothetical protein